MPCPRIPVTGLVSTLFLSQVQTLIAQEPGITVGETRLAGVYG